MVRGINLSPTIQTSINFRRYVELHVRLTGPCQKLNKMWKSLFQTLILVILINFTFLLFVLVSLLFLFTSSPSLATVPAVTDGDFSILLPVTNSNSFVLEQIIIIGILIH